MAFSKIALIVFFGLFWNISVAQINGEEGQLTPEYLDATFTGDDAARTPYTHTSFLIGEQLKGDDQSNVITLIQPGGPSQ